MDKTYRWLERHHLQQYAEQFQREKITFDLLPLLGEPELRELGLKLGERLRFRQALEADNPNQAPPQNRLLTVLFIDLVGSTELSLQLEPEIYRQLILKYRATVENEVVAHRGAVTRFAGDAVVAYFGWPQAMERSAALAVQAALSALIKISNINSTHHQPLQARAGIASGPVVVEEQHSNGTLENIAVGPTPNLASRLQNLADTSTLVICEQSRLLCGGQFELKDLGKQTIKGFEHAQQSWLVLRESTYLSRYEAATQQRQRRLIGRAGAIEQLQVLWDEALANKPRCTLLLGEPGLGKSSLAHHLLEHVKQQGYASITLQCASYFVDDAYYPIHRIIDRKLDTKATKFNQHMRRLLAPLRQGADTGHSEAQQQKLRAVRAIRRYLLKVLRGQASLVLVEDIHWIDQSSLELLQQVCQSLRDQRVLLLLTSRPEGESIFSQSLLHEVITLQALDPSASAAVVRAIASNRPIDEKFVDKIVERAEGVPLFLEEFTLSILKHSADTEPTELSIPSTLQESLMARLDRHPAMRAVAQHAAVLGREFNTKVFETLIKILPDEIQQTGVQALFDDGLLLHNETTLTYQFKHALLRDLAYQSLVREARESIHLRVANTIRKDFPHLAEQQPSRLAQHLAAAGQFTAAISLWLRAVDESIARFAFTEGRLLLNSAEPLLVKLTHKDERDRYNYEISLRSAYLFAYGRWSAANTLDAFNRTEEFAKALQSNEKIFEARLGLWSCYRSQPDFNEALELGKKLYATAQKLNDPYYITRAKIAVHTSNFYRGELKECNKTFDNNTDAIKKMPTERMTRDPMNTRVSAPAELFLKTLLFGQSAKAHQLMQKHIEDYSDFNSPQTRIWLYFVASTFYEILGDVERVDEYSSIALSLSIKHRVSPWTELTQTHRAWVAIERSELAAAHAAFAQIDISKTKVMRPYYQCVYARLLLRENKLQDAIDSIDEALHLAVKTHEVWWNAALLMLRGDCRQQAGISDYRAALACALQQGNTLLALSASSKILACSVDHKPDNRDLVLLKHLLAQSQYDTNCRVYRVALETLEAQERNKHIG